MRACVFGGRLRNGKDFRYGVGAGFRFVRDSLADFPGVPGFQRVDFGKEVT